MVCIHFSGHDGGLCSLLVEVFLEVDEACLEESRRRKKLQSLDNEEQTDGGRSGDLKDHKEREVVTSRLMLRRAESGADSHASRMPIRIRR
ncbi:hypothetical protein M747DRAFT_292779 [Aspergillus niger ATCC 13496]|uniref:Uncharacterized protein n=1 Tax=Aspergillus niger ATCC 13496 TaxID=1353008 RepID=A0A370CCM4_ASPNG|nr:hypothetical protein M747DRAFT_292779 [Aspergillus niger ATCC 13496]